MRKVAVIDLPFRGRNEFLPLAGDPSIDFAYVKPFDFERRFPEGADVIVLPGSGKTIADLHYFKSHGGHWLIQSHLSRGGVVVGICGGFQSLGRELYDPFKRQGHLEVTRGLGWLPVGTTFGAKMFKSTTDAVCVLDGASAQGVEFRSGSSWLCHPGLDRDSQVEPAGFSRLYRVADRKLEKELPEPTLLEPGVIWAPGTESYDGWVSSDRKVWGTYLHLVFHNESFRRLFFSSM